MSIKDNRIKNDCSDCVHKIVCKHKEKRDKIIDDIEAIIEDTHTKMELKCEYYLPANRVRIFER